MSSVAVAAVQCVGLIQFEPGTTATTFCLILSAVVSSRLFPPLIFDIRLFERCHFSKYLLRDVHWLMT
jgi:hypothetical protein